MGAWTVTIGGDDVSAYVQYGVSLSSGINERPNVRLQLKVRDGVSYTGPAVRDNIDIEDGADVVFRGIVWTVRESPVIDDKHRQYDVECVGYQALADVVLFNGTLGPGTMESMLNTLALNLAVHGIQVDPAQATGPTLEAMSFTFATATQVLDSLAGASAYNVVWDGDYVRLQDPGTVSAPFDLTESNSTICGLEHTQTLLNYVNEIWVIFGDSSVRDVTDSFLGDGTTKTFALHYVPSAAPGYVSENSVSYPVAPYGSTGYRWYYNSADQTMVVDAAAAAPTNGHVILVPFPAQFPGSYFVRDAVEYAAHGPWTITVAYPDIFEWSHAAYAANWELDRRKGVVKRVKVKTFSSGLEPGMDINITATNYGLSGTNCLITNVRASHVLKKQNGDALVEYQIEALEGNQWQQNWHEYFRKLNTGTGVGSSASVLTGGGGGGVVTSTGPFRVLLGVRGEDDPIFAPSADTWFDAPGHVDWVLRGNQIGGLIRMRIHLKSASTNATVSARYYNTSASAAASDATTGVNSTTLTHREVNCTLVSDLDQVYRLQLKVSGSAATTAPVSYAKPTLENSV
jgi:hypothetical protein